MPGVSTGLASEKTGTRSRMNTTKVGHAGRVTSTVSRGVAVQLEGVRRVFDNKHVVSAGMDLRIDAGEFLAVLGPTGCGKSTLLRMIARLAEPDAGRIRTEPDGERFQTAFVFQDAHLLPWRNVLDNAALPLELMGEAKAKREERARAALEQVGLLEALDRYPAQLSGGMRMRASLARALVTEPRLLLLDEPFAALDEITRFHLDVQLRELWRRRRMTVIFVTHSVSEAAFLANRAVVLGRNGGAIRLDRTLELPAVRDNELRGDPRLGQEMRLLLGAIEE
jgi:NitT/TauT family transport system ATP-binding protein